MTIAAGFRCADGIVIGADTEIAEGNIKSYQSKLFPIPSAGDGLMVITGAGNFGSISHCAQLMRERNLERCDGSLRELTGEIRRFITGKPYRELAQRDSLTEFIIALRSSDHQTQLFRLRGAEFFPAAQYVAVGSGCEAATFIAQWLYDGSFDIDPFIPLAVQVFRAAKSQNVGVSGDTEIFRLYNSGKSEPKNIWNDKEFLWGLHDVLAKVIGFMVQPAASPGDERFEKWLEQFCKKARDVRASFISDQKSREAFLSMLQRLQSTTGDSSHQRPSLGLPEESDES